MTMSNNGMLLGACVAAAIGAAGAYAVTNPSPARAAPIAPASAPADQKLCKLNGPGQTGRTIKANQLIRFRTNLNGVTQYKAGTEDDLRWVKTNATAWAPKGCSLTIYLENGAHIRSKTDAYQIPAGSRGVGCNCP